ncbi:hypothetical protein DFH08DRAFT_822370 [Mycena albidolilacea]|uniref:Uncharacterized protein n=1 Tax=Mycena albidolilacea TaxID=1033008 RepID=A0AAD6Z8G8_9AGAR|nr:hypothetical protein DFH08DRAFT_822370 [Mycena albidolilacea]
MFRFADPPSISYQAVPLRREDLLKCHKILGAGVPCPASRKILGAGVLCPAPWKILGAGVPCPALRKILGAGVPCPASRKILGAGPAPQKILGTEVPSPALKKILGARVSCPDPKKILGAGVLHWPDMALIAIKMCLLNEPWGAYPKDMKEINAKRAAGEDDEEDSERGPEEFQEALDQLGEVVERVLQTIGEETGWSTCVMLGRPVPHRQGAISMRTFCLGTTPHGSDFQLFHPEFEAQVKMPFGQFLKRAYPHDVRMGKLN